MLLMTHTLTPRAEPPRNRDADLTLVSDADPLRESDPGLAAERDPAAESDADVRDENNVDAPGEIDPSFRFIASPSYRTVFFLSKSQFCYSLSPSPFLWSGLRKIAQGPQPQTAAGLASLIPEGLPDSLGHLQVDGCAPGQLAGAEAGAHSAIRPRLIRW